MTIDRYDHIAIAVADITAMVGFYRRLGFDVRSNEEAGNGSLTASSGNVRLNFHLTQVPTDTQTVLKPRTMAPGSASICFGWAGTLETVTSFLLGLRVEILDGPVHRFGTCKGSNVHGQSVYIRDPDGNLLEFMVYE